MRRPLGHQPGGLVAKLVQLGNALVDIFLELNEAEFATLGFERHRSTS